MNELLARLTSRRGRRLAAAVLALAVAVVAFQVWNGYRVRAMRDSGWPDPVKKKAESVIIESGASKLRLQRKAGEWYAVDSGVELRADPGRVESFLRFIYVNKPLRRLGRLDTSRLAEYGLSPPRTRITVGSPLRWEIDLGAPAPGGEGVYARSSLEPMTLLLLDTEYLRQADKRRPYFQDMRLLPLDPSRVTRFRLLDGAGKGFMVKRLDRDRFAFSWPAELDAVPADAAEAERYLHELASLKASALLPGVQPPPGRPSLLLELWTEEGGPMSIEVFEGDGGERLGHSSWQPVYFALDQDRVNGLQISSFALRDRRILDFAPSAVDKIRLAASGRVVAASRNADELWLDEATGREIVGIDMFLWRLRNTRYESEPASVPPGTDEILSLELIDGNGKRIDSAAFFDAPGQAGRCWLKPADSGWYYPVADGLLHDILSGVPWR